MCRYILYERFRKSLDRRFSQWNSGCYVWARVNKRVVRLWPCRCDCYVWIHLAKEVVHYREGSGSPAALSNGYHSSTSMSSGERKSYSDEDTPPPAPQTPSNYSSIDIFITLKLTNVNMLCIFHIYGYFFNMTPHKSIPVSTV